MYRSLLLLLALPGLALADPASRLLSDASSGGCNACMLTLHHLREHHGANPSVLLRQGGSICTPLEAHLRSGCEGLVGLFGAHVDEDLLLASSNNLCARSGICESSASPDVLISLTDGDDTLFALNGDGSLTKDDEDRDEAKAQERKREEAAGGNGAGQSEAGNKAKEADDKDEAVATAVVAEKKKAAKEVKKVAAAAHEATKAAVKIAVNKAVTKAKKKWLKSWRTRKWPANVSVPKKASKLACTEESLGRIAFRGNEFYGCKVRSTKTCKQCNCREEEKVVEDADCKCFKRVKKEVCDSCCTNKCGPQWIAFADCARTCEECDCKVEHGIKVCQSCCKEKCGPKWHKGPI